MDNKKERKFLGQPLGLRTLFLTEFWERFSYYGMRAILIYYMYTAVKDGGLGMSQTTAASIMAIYGSLVYMTSVLGGFLSDRIFGTRRTVFWGGVLIMLGHIVLSLPIATAGLFGSIILITIGTGMLKPNVSEMVGGLYTADDPRRDSGFSIYVMGINLGSLIAPIAVGGVQSAYNYHAGFSLAAIGMFFGLIVYLIDGRKYLSKASLVAPDPLEGEEKTRFIKRLVYSLIAVAIIVVLLILTKNFNIENVITLISILGVVLPIAYFVLMLRSDKVTKIEKSRVRAYIPMFIIAVIFWAIEEQGSVVLALFAANQTQLQFGTFNINPANFQLFNPLFITIYSPIFAFLWTKLGKRQPSSPTKFWMGLMIAGISYLFISIPLIGLGKNELVNPVWLVATWAIMMIGELLISPVGMSTTTKLAPKAFSSQMMSMWFLADAAGQAINAQIVKYFDAGNPKNEIIFFTSVGTVAIVFSIVLIFLVPMIKRQMQGVN
ncbi:peptide MFS transporter [Lactobacillus terrae]|uniref:peptide MFS transporter n=1 Tax=Lactobacillus terrae TaxID=2269374 RepID=UPI000C1B76A9|nr:peptide MFS transporter [Lactobacillus terrae]